MKRTRNNYHNTVKSVKKETEVINSKLLLDAAQKGNIHLMNELKKLRQSGKNAGSRPEVIENADNPEDIVMKFKEVYAALYNCSPSVMDEVMNKIQMDENSRFEVEKVTGRIVKLAASRMKSGKSDISGSFTSDAILNGPDNLFTTIASVFRSYLYHGTVTKAMLACAFLPLLKSMKDPSKIDSYRAIAASSLILKLLDNVILILCGDTF